VVIVIIGILATLGFSQYVRMIEKSRGAEARMVLGNIRTQAAALWIENGNGSTMPTGIITNTNVGINTTIGSISGACAAVGTDPGGKYFFSYNIDASTATGFTATATRCIGANGKAPGAPVGTVTSLTLTTDFAAGTDTWSGPY